MRLFTACTSVVVALATTFPATAEPASPPDTANQSLATQRQQTDPAARIPHPVIYLDSLKTQSTTRIPHPVVYDTTRATPPKATARVPHPVVYDNAVAPPATETAPTEAPTIEAKTTPHIPPKVDYENDTSTSPDTEPVVAPPNPDLDTSEPEVAKPTPTEQPTQVIAAPRPKNLSPAASSIETLITTKALGDLQDSDWTGIAKVYASRFHEPVWVAQTGLTPKGRKLVATLNTADDWGLDPKHFTTPDITDAKDGAAALDPETWSEVELKLTAAALRYASHARGGRILDPTKQLSSYLDRKPQLKDPGVVLADLVTAEDPSVVLHALHPSHPQFEKLRQKYLALKSASERPQVVRIPRGKLLRNGMKHAHVALLRKRLEIAEVAPDDGTAFDPELYDDTVEAAVKSFQKDYGISADGLVGNGTRNALNDIEGPNPEQLLANMEQWRWMPDDLGETHVWVNIPEFKVRLIRNGEVVYEERIIAGETNKQTPVFSDTIETLYFHPRWNVPNSIKVNEIYPSLARGGSYARRQNLRIAYNGRSIDPYSMDWSNRDIRRYHVYQPPGPGNVLGVVKFTFPNKHQVYMHDTPTKHLFKKKTRTFSHGCMRVRDPVRLAELIVETANGMTQSDVNDILKGPRKETPVKLDQKIPVHVTYLTAWVDEDGNEHSAKDIYGHEKKIKLALAGRFDRIAVGPDHLAPVKFKPRPQQYYGTTAVEDFFKNLFPGF